MVTYFLPNLMKCPKMGSIGQIFASLLAKKTVLNQIKHTIILKRNGVVWCIESALNDLVLNFLFPWLRIFGINVTNVLKLGKK